MYKLNISQSDQSVTYAYCNYTILTLTVPKNGKIGKMCPKRDLGIFLNNCWEEKNDLGVILFHILYTELACQLFFIWRPDLWLRIIQLCHLAVILNFVVNKPLLYLITAIGKQWDTLKIIADTLYCTLPPR